MQLLFDDEVGRGILHILLLIFCAVSLIQLAAGVIGSAGGAIIQAIVGLALCLTCFLLLRRNVRVAAAFMIGALWLLILGSAYLTSGNRSVGLAALPLLIVFCAWVVHIRSAQIMAVLSICVVFGFSLHETLGGNYHQTYSPLHRWLILSIFLLVATALASQVVAQYWQRLQQQSALAHHLNILIDHVPACVCSIDENHCYIYANHLYASFFGREPEELVGKRVEDIIGKDNFSLRRDAFESASLGKTMHYRRDHINPETGRRRVIDVDLVPENQTDGKSRSRYFGLLREVTEEVLAIEDARESEERFAILFRANPFATSISRMDDGTFIDINRAYEEMYGTRRENLIGKSSIRDGLWPTLEHRLAWIATLGDGRGRHDYETQLATTRGELRDVILTSERLDIDGEARLLTLHNDITARKNAEREVRRLNETLEEQVKERTAALSEALSHLERSQEELIRAEKLAALGGMVAGLAHELNTPIGNAVTVASTLAEHTREFAAQINSGDGLRKSTLLHFCNNSLDGSDILLRNLERAHDLLRNFKQMAIDQTSENRRVFRFDQTVSEIIAAMTPALKRQPIKIQNNIVSDIELDSFPGALGQVLINLINNAILHGFEKAKSGHISISGEIAASNANAPKRVRLTIEDDGIGIPPQHLGHIFEPFFTTKLGQGGSGLGLSIIYNIVTSLLGGEIHCESTLGQGTRFIILLPLRAPETAAQMQKPGLPPPPCKK